MNKEEVINILKEIQARPIKDLGQNFLINPKITEKIVKASGISEKDTVLEIGPGLGILTEDLLKKTNNLILIEKDRVYFKYLKDKYKQIKTVKIFNEDILDYNLNQNSLSDYKVAANIPYNITSKIIYLFLESKKRPKAMSLLVQKEVARKMLGGSRKNNFLSLLIEILGKIELICDVGRENFYPEPKVDSAAIRIKDIRREIDLNKGYYKKLLRLIKIGFSAPRKKLLNNLVVGFKFDKEELSGKFLKAGLDINIRAEELSLKKWEGLFKELN